MAGVVLVVFVLSFVRVFPPGSWAYGLERLQFVPALMATVQGRTWGWVVLASLLVLTLLLGRVYCSWICPLGMLQDVVNRLRHPRPQTRRGREVRFTPNHWVVRTVAGLLVLGSVPVVGSLLLTWLDPYSMAARLMAAVVNPAAAWVAEAAGWSGQPPDWLRYMPWLVVLSLLGVALPVAMALWRGRLYCNTLCPVGAWLGLLARVAPLTPHIDRSRCGLCSSCLRECKAHAIDLKNQRVDATRCVACYNCVTSCNRGAMRVRWHNPLASAARKKRSVRKPLPAPEKARESVPAVDPGRRALLGLGLVSLAGAVLPEPRAEPSRDLATVGTNLGPATLPPGAGSLEHFLSTCTGCGLCISACPTHVLRPSFTVLGWAGLMKPYLDYSAAYCDADCCACSGVCPTGALFPLSLERKRKTQLALVSYLQRNCRVWQEGEACASCAAHCPTGAITAVELRRPVVQADQCVGCKAKRCYNACPTGSVGFMVREDNGRRLAVINYGTCVGCGYCAEACVRHRGIVWTTVKVPKFTPQLCNGCGACEHVCPTRPRALAVQPRREHLLLP